MREIRLIKLHRSNLVGDLRQTHILATLSVQSAVSFHLLILNLHSIFLLCLAWCMQMMHVCYQQNTYCYTVYHLFKTCLFAQVCILTTIGDAGCFVSLRWVSWEWKHGLFWRSFLLSSILCHCLFVSTVHSGFRGSVEPYRKGPECNWHLD